MLSESGTARPRPIMARSSSLSKLHKFCNRVVGAVPNGHMTDSFEADQVVLLAYDCKLFADTVRFLKCWCSFSWWKRVIMPCFLTLYRISVLSPSQGCRRLKPPSPISITSVLRVGWKALKVDNSPGRYSCAWSVQHLFCAANKFQDPLSPAIWTMV